MKTRLFSILLLLSFFADAQTYQAMNGYGYRYKRTISDTALGIPKDTFAVPSAYQSIPFLSSKNGVLYLWSTDKWVLASTGTVTPATSWGSITGTLSSQSDLMAALNAKQAALPLGTTAQYLRGDHSLSTFTTDVRTYADTRYSLLGHTHTAANITDFTTASRNLFSGGTGISYNPATGVISSTGGGASALTYITPLSLVSDTVRISQADGTTDGYLSAVDWSIFNQKIGQGDTTSMLANYRHWTQGYLKSVDVAGKLNISDTASMLAPYLRNNYFSAGSGISIAGGVISNTKKDFYAEDGTLTGDRFVSGDYDLSFFTGDYAANRWAGLSLFKNGNVEWYNKTPTGGYNSITLLNNGITINPAGDLFFSSIDTTNTASWVYVEGSLGELRRLRYTQGITSETDPVFTASSAAGITGTNISNWNTAYSWGDHAVQGYLTGETDPNLPQSADATTNKYLNWNNGAYIRKQIAYSEISGTPTITNIYNSDGTLTGNRTVTLGGNDLFFNGANGSATAFYSDGQFETQSFGTGSNYGFFTVYPNKVNFYATNSLGQTSIGDFSNGNITFTAPNNFNITGLPNTTTSNILYYNTATGKLSYGATPNSMVYPAAGIPVSTGTAWGSSIADNSANWNTAYSWGNHATQGYMQTLSIAGNNLTISGGNTIGLPSAYSWSGSFAGVSGINGNYTLEAAYQAYYITTSGITVTVPTMTGNANRVFFLKNKSNGNVTIQRSGTDNFYTTSAVTSFTMAPGDYLMIWNDGVNWNVHQMPTESDPSVPTLVKNIPVSADAATNKYLNWDGSAYIRKQIDYSEIANTPTTSTPTLQQVLTAGKTLTENSVIQTQTFSLSAIGNPSSNGTIWGTSTGTQAGGFFENTGSGRGINVESIGNAAASFRRSNTGTSDVATLMEITRMGGAVTNGFGASIDFSLERSVEGNTNLSTKLVSKWSNAVLASLTSEFDIIGHGNGSILTFANFQTGGVVRVNNNADTLATKAYARSVGGGGGGSMVYPAAGIAISTGTAWGTSITDNSANWNTAYSWGNHASAGYLNNAYTSITDGTTTTTASGATVFKIRSADNKLSVAVTDNDATHGDNVLLTVNEANLTLAQSQVTNLTTDLAAKQPQLNGTGFVKASGTTISYDNSTYLTTETDPVVQAINGIVYSNGTTISAAVAGNFPTLNQNTTGSAASFTGSLAGDVTGTQGATVVGRINGVSMAGLATGIVKNTTTTGVPSIAVAGTDYVAPSATFFIGTTSIAHNRASASQALTGITSIDGTAVSVTGTNVVTNTNLSQMAANTIKGNNTAGTANAADLTTAQVKTMLSLNNVENTALSTWTGSTNVTTLGTIGTGTWQGSLVNSTYGGTGVNNGGRTITVAGNFATSGAFATTLTATAATNVTLPTTGTLATLAGSETLTNKTFNFSNNTVSMTTAQLNTALSDNDIQPLDADLTTLAASTGTKDNSTYYAGDGTFRTAVFSKGIAIVSPTATENITVWKTPHALTITGVDVVIQGSSSPSVTYVLNYGSSRTSATGTIVASNTVTATGAATLNTTSIPAGSYVWVTTSAASGTIDEFSLTINYKQ